MFSLIVTKIHMSQEKYFIFLFNFAEICFLSIGDMLQIQNIFRYFEVKKYEQLKCLIHGMNKTMKRYSHVCVNIFYAKCVMRSSPLQYKSY